MVTMEQVRIPIPIWISLGSVWGAASTTQSEKSTIRLEFEQNCYNTIKLAL